MAVASPPFAGFRPEAIQFLADLAENNDRAWFQPRKADYERLLKEPLEAFVAAVGERLEARLLFVQADVDEQGQKRKGLPDEEDRQGEPHRDREGLRPHGRGGRGSQRRGGEAESRGAGLETPPCFHDRSTLPDPASPTSGRLTGC